MKDTRMMIGYSCLIVVLYATPIFSSTGAVHRALQKGRRQDVRLTTDEGRGGSWWWGARGGMVRSRGGLYRSSKRSSGCAAHRAAGGADASGESMLRDAQGRSCLAVAHLLARGGANGGYNYDDDYYGGQGGGDDPYYEDAGWGDDMGRGGRDGGRYDPYEDRGVPKKRGKGTSMAGFDLTGTITNGNKKYGIYALAGSILLTMMGVSLMFEKNLIRLGNLGFVAGMALFIGPSNVVRYFTQSSKLRGFIIFAVGFFFVFTGHPIIGLALEAFGFLNLFGNMLPMIWAMASNMPFVREMMASSSKQKKSGRNKQKRSSRGAPSREYDQGYGYEEDEWDNGGGGGGGGWGYDDYDYDRR